MSTPYSPRAELAAAVRAVNAEFARLDDSARPRVEIVPDADVDAAILAGDRDRAFTAIGDWRRQQLAAIREAAR